MTNIEIINRLWNLCNVLRDDGITYHQYVTELTYILFLKMAKETGTEKQIPQKYRWDKLYKKPIENILPFYVELLRELGSGTNTIIKSIFDDAKTGITEPKNLRKIITEIDKLDWYSAKVEGLGDIYEGLLEKNANEKKSGAGQYFTPRPLVEVMVRVSKPQLGERINDPACGTFGFMIAANQYLRQCNDYTKLSAAAYAFQKKDALIGCELVKDTHRLAMMNALLHDLDSNIVLGDTLSPLGKTFKNYDLVLTNPPFGTKSGGERAMRDDLQYPSSNKQLNFLQHIYLSLAEKRSARAAVVVPDNVLFGDGEGAKVRAFLLDNFNLDAILRLPTGIFYAQGVNTNVLFFDRQKDNTTEVWFYDMRSNMRPFGRRNPLTTQHFSDFVKEYEKREEYTREDFIPFENAMNATDRSTVTDQRFSRVSRENIEANGGSLDLGLMVTSIQQDATDPTEIAKEIMSELQIVVNDFNKLLYTMNRDSAK